MASADRGLVSRSDVCDFCAGARCQLWTSRALFELVDTPSASVLERFTSREALLSMTILYGWKTSLHYLRHLDLGSVCYCRICTALLTIHPASRIPFWKHPLLPQCPSRYDQNVYQKIRKSIWHTLFSLSFVFFPHNISRRYFHISISISASFFFEQVKRILLQVCTIIYFNSAHLLDI